MSDIEPAADLPLYPGERARDYSVRIYHGSPYDGQVRFQNRVPSPAKDQLDWWELLRDTLTQVLPPSGKLN